MIKLTDLDNNTLWVRSTSIDIISTMDIKSYASQYGAAGAVVHVGGARFAVHETPKEILYIMGMNNAQ